MPTSALSSLRDPLHTTGPDSEPIPQADGPGFQPRQLVLLGAGDAHLHVLDQLARNPMVGVRITLICPYGKQMVAGLMPELIAGNHAADDCTLALEPLVRRSGVRWLSRSVRSLRAAERSVELDDGSVVTYDWLSINTGPVQNRLALEERMPGAREYGLFLHPMESFAALWPQVVSIGMERTLSVAVIGGGQAGIEVALAVRQRLPRSAITLLNAEHPPGARWSPEVQRKLLAELKAQRVMVIVDRVIGVGGKAIQLASGATLRCDVPLIASGAEIPTWLAESGLALIDATPINGSRATGALALANGLHSASHAEVFAAGFVGQTQGPAGPSLIAALRQATHNDAAQAEANSRTKVVKNLRPQRLQFIAWGQHRALLVWGKLCVQGRLAGALRAWLQRRFVAHYTHTR